MKPSLLRNLLTISSVACLAVTVVLYVVTFKAQKDLKVELGNAIDREAVLGSIIQEQQAAITEVTVSTERLHLLCDSLQTVPSDSLRRMLDDIDLLTYDCLQR